MGRTCLGGEESAAQTDMFETPAGRFVNAVKDNRLTSTHRQASETAPKRTWGAAFSPLPISETDGGASKL